MDHKENINNKKTCYLLGYYASSSGNLLPTFRDPIGCSETSAMNYHYTRRNDPGERSFHLLGGGNLKSRVLMTGFLSKSLKYLGFRVLRFYTEVRK